MLHEEKANILIVDDRIENLVALEALLEKPDRNIIRATSGNEALGQMLEHDFALVLLDVQMPDMDGFETATLMHSSEKTKNVPIIFVTAISKEDQHVFRGYQSGAVDYLFKPIDPTILTSKVNFFLELYRHKKNLEQTAKDRKDAIEELKIANRKLLEQHKMIVEEERLKVLLQMAGATAHELNQPLMALLGNIELMGLNKNNPLKLEKYISRVDKAGRWISDIVNKIQTIRHDLTKPYLNDTLIINLDQKISLLVISSAGKIAETVQTIFKSNERISIETAVNIEQAISILFKAKLDLIFFDNAIEGANCIEFLNKLQKEGMDIPFVLVTDKGDEKIAAQAINTGAMDYLPKEEMNEASLSRILMKFMEISRLSNEVKEAQIRLAELSDRSDY